MDGSAGAVRPHRFTVADYHRMAEAGILGEDSRVELIRGQIVDMAPIGAPHIGTVIRLTGLLSALLAGRASVSVQNPVRLDDGSEPEPDFAVLKLRADHYGRATPTAEDVLLLIEVADSSLEDDRAKVPLYAEGGIPEFWIINIPECVVEVYREPNRGSYASRERVGPGGILAISALPGATLAADDLFLDPKTRT